MTSKFSAALLFILFVVLYLLPLQGHPLFVPDETRYAEIPREMVESGDWVVPRLNGVRYFEKPVMGYWLSAISLTLFGENNFAVRLPSALAAGFTALFIFFLCFGSFTKESRVPLLAPFVFLTTSFVAALGTIATLDTLLSLFLTATLVLFFKACEERAGSSREKWFLFVAGLFAGCAFLTKGFLAFVIPVLAAGPYLLFQKRWSDTLRMLVLPVVGAVLISLPWAVLIHQREPDFWNYFFWYEHVHRFLSDTAQHSEPFYYFFAALPVIFMPWTFLLPASLAGSLQKGETTGAGRRLLLYCLCWFVFPLLFFTASSGKLVTYILPCLPPIAILFTHGLCRLKQGEDRKRDLLQWGIATLGILVFLLLLVLLASHLFAPVSLIIYTHLWKLLLIAGGLLTMCLLLIVSFRSCSIAYKIRMFGMAFAVLLATGYFAIPTQTLTRKAPAPLFENPSVQINPDTYVIAGGEIFRAACWYLKRSDVYLLGSFGELEYGLKKEGDKMRVINILDAYPFITNNAGKVVLILDYKEYNILKPYLPPPVSIRSSGKKGTLLLRY